MTLSAFQEKYPFQENLTVVERKSSSYIRILYPAMQHFIIPFNTSIYQNAVVAS